VRQSRIISRDLSAIPGHMEFHLQCENQKEDHTSQPLSNRSVKSSDVSGRAVDGHSRRSISMKPNAVQTEHVSGTRAQSFLLEV
jgi:hypothetical protein